MADVPPSADGSVTGGALPLSPAHVGGRRHRVKKVSAKTIKRTLKRLGMKPKGRVVLRGGDVPAPEGTTMTPPEAEGGRRHRRGTKKTHRRRHRRSLFGLKY